MTARYDGIVVGIDAPVVAHEAIGWAVAEANARHVPLRIVHALDPAVVEPPVAGAGGFAWPAVSRDALRASAEETLRHAEMYAVSLDPSIAVTTVCQEGRPAAVLRAVAGPQELVVIGSRHLGAVRSAVLGSTGTGLAHGASAPFVVVRGKVRTSGEAPVVVGVDATTSCAPVLAAAFDHAAVHGLPLRAVMCWEPYYYAPRDRVHNENQDVEAEAGLWLAEALAGWREAYPEVQVERSLVFEYPSVALTGESVRASLVVVGIGGNRLTRLLGSVAAGVLHHADCPVAVVPQ